jgi:phosphoribosylformylglycinamidine synthase subunit PurS
VAHSSRFGLEWGPTKAGYCRSTRPARCVRPATYNNFVTAYVYVSLKKSVLDPQGKTIQGALKKMGYQGLESVRQGKYFEITLDGGLSREQAQAEVERMAREVLTNPVIEEFRFSISE